METLALIDEDARRLKDLLDTFNYSRSHFIQEGSLRIDNVTLDWNKDVIRISVKHTPPISH